MEKLVVGCGYLGQRVARAWKRAGDIVHAATRSTQRAEEFRMLGWIPIILDVADAKSMPSLARFDTVLHCVGFDRALGRGMREIYVDGLRNLLEHLPPSGRFIHVSSTSVYGQSKSELVDEDSLTAPTAESGRIVLVAEKVLYQCLPNAITLRFAGIYGPGRLLRTEKALRAGEPISSDPDRWLNLIHVDDGVRAIQAAEIRGQPGRTYNVSDGQPVKRRDYYARMAELLGAPPPRFESSADGATDRENNNRRISNLRMMKELRPELVYPSCETGLRNALGMDRQTVLD